MKKVMDSNIYDVNETIIIMGSCLKCVQPLGFERLKEMSENIYEICLEETHINMAITKIGGMLRTGIVKNIIFASVDRSPHCTQLHYIQDELVKMMDIRHINISNYVVVDNELIKLSPKIISLSKTFKELVKLGER